MPDSEQLEIRFRDVWFMGAVLDQKKLSVTPLLLILSRHRSVNQGVLSALRPVPSPRGICTEAPRPTGPLAMRGE